MPFAQGSQFQGCGEVSAYEERTLENPCSVEINTPDVTEKLKCATLCERVEVLSAKRESRSFSYRGSNN